MQVFEPKLKNIVKAPNLIPEGAEFLFVDPYTGTLKIAESRNCQQCDSQAYINAANIMVASKLLHNFPFFYGQVNDYWCNDEGEEYCDSCGDPSNN